MKTDKQKGFTIIELVVVIAIIGILAAVVMVNVISYIGKGRDAAIKSNLANTMVAATLYYEGTPSGSVACADPGVKAAYDAAALISGAESCADDTGKYCACAQLVSNTAKYFCVDSTGNKRESAITCATDCADGSDYICDGL